MKKSEMKVRAWLYNMHNPDAARLREQLQHNANASNHTAPPPSPVHTKDEYIHITEHNKVVDSLRLRCEGLERKEMLYRSLYKEAQKRYTTCLYVAPFVS